MRSLITESSNNLGNCVAPSRTAYRSAQRRYLAFCSRFGVSVPYPLQEDTLCSYVAYLAKDGLKHHTIKAYLSGIRCLQIQHSMGNPFANGGMPLLEYVLSGIKRVEAQSGSQTQPITIDVLRKLRMCGSLLPCSRTTLCYGRLHV